MAAFHPEPTPGAGTKRQISFTSSANLFCGMTGGGSLGTRCLDRRDGATATAGAGIRFRQRDGRVSLLTLTSSKPHRYPLSPRIPGCCRRGALARDGGRDDEGRPRSADELGGYGPGGRPCDRVVPGMPRHEPGRPLWPISRRDDGEQFSAKLRRTVGV
jgi:hypothetical protein